MRKNEKRSISVFLSVYRFSGWLALWFLNWGVSEFRSARAALKVKRFMKWFHSWVRVSLSWRRSSRFIAWCASAPDVGIFFACSNIDKEQKPTLTMYEQEKSTELEFEDHWSTILTSWSSNTRTMAMKKNHQKREAAVRSCFLLCCSRDCFA